MNDKQLDRELIRRRYANSSGLWSDAWHSVAGKRIEQNVAAFMASLSRYPAPRRTLNAGSAGCTYGRRSACDVHLDLVANGLREVPLGVYGDIEALPFPDDSFDLCLCVGSVLNYCSAIEALSEIDRVLQPGAHLILEFERSESSEYLWKPGHRVPADLVESSYNGSPERIWIYSEQFIRHLLKESGYRTLSSMRFHVLSPLIYRAFRNERFATRFAALDPILGRMPLLSRGASNAILLCRKSA